MNRIVMKGFNVYPLPHMIKKILALGMSSLLVTSSNAWAENYINPNEIWISTNGANEVCSLDFDQDGDLDLIYYSQSLVRLQENIGSLASPIFSSQKALVSASHELQVKALLNSPACQLKGVEEAFVDIDHDGDLDLFKAGTLDSASKELNPVTFFEQTESGLKQFDNTFGLQNKNIFSFAFIDIDNDGDDDFFANGGSSFYENTGTPQTPNFVLNNNFLKCGDDRPERSVLIDLNGDKQLDRVCEEDKTVWLSSESGYVKNSQVFQGSSSERFNSTYSLPALDINQDGSPELAITFVKDLDQIAQIRDINRDVILFDRKNPVITGVTHSSLSRIGVEEGNSNFLSGDLDGDGDHDLYVLYPQYKFYDNIGTFENPEFKHISHTPSFSNGNTRQAWLDADNDGRVESIFLDFERNIRFLNKGLEPATDITVQAYDSENLIVAVNRPSQVQLYLCRVNKGCNAPTVLPNTAKEISVKVGDFVHTVDNNHDEIALAIVDEQGLIKLHIYDVTGHKFNIVGAELKLISQGQGGKAHSLSMSAGQLDNDPEDEVALTFVQENGNVLSAGVNFDMSIIGLAQLGQGNNPSIAVGKFSDTLGSYVTSYITPDNQLKISTIQGDGTIISQIDGGSASDATVSKSTFVSSTSQDEYIVSTHQANGTSELTGFLSDGKVLGKLSLGATQQPTIISRYSESKVSLGLAVSVIQADKKPAVIFLDNLGNILATGVGGKTAMVATVADGGNGNAILAYVDESGIPRWETFSADGVKQP